MPDFVRQMGTEGHLSDKFIREHLENEGVDLSTCPGLGNVDEEVDDLTVNQRRSLILTNKEFVASLVEAAEEKQRVAEAKLVAAAAEKAERAAKKQRLAEEKADRATEKERKRVEKAQKEVCSEGHAVARFGESVA
jgi:hypothetical protein